MALAAVATGCGNERRTLQLAPTTSAAQVAGNTVVRTTTTATTAARRATSTTSTTTVAGDDGAATTDPPADRCAAQENDPRRVVQPTFPSGLVATSTEHGVRLSYPTPWRVDQVVVAANQLVPPAIVADLGLRADATVRPLSVRAPSQYPGVAIARLGSLKSDLAAITTAVRAFMRERGFVVRPGVVGGCLDKEPAVGLIAVNDKALDAVWFAFHSDALYIVVCLAHHDGSARNQADLLSQFQSVLETVRWTE